MININININLEENRIYLSSKNNLENVRINIYNWKPYNDEEIIIYSSLITINGNITYWYAPVAIMKDNFGIKVKIFENDIILKEEKFRLKSRYGKIIKNQALVIHSSGGMGDNLICTPIIRKLYQLYNRKITLYTYYPEIFINNPYIENIIKISIDQNSYNLQIDQDKYEIHNIWHTYFLPFNVTNRNTFTESSTLGWLASQIGLGLNNDELNLDFFADDYSLIENLPDKYIVINPNITSKSRTWGINNWNNLIQLLEKKNISIVALGKKSTLWPEEKSYLNEIIITNGLNLIGNDCQNTLSQAWHIINKSMGVITHNTGLYCLTLSTDTNIFELGTYLKPYYFRNTNNTKHYYIVGDCKLFCTNDLYNYISEHGTINCLVPGECLLNKSTFECHPTPEQVYESVLKIIK